MHKARFAILAQILRRRLESAHWRRWALALVLPFVGVVTAFGIAPDTVTETVERSHVVENLTLPTTLLVTEREAQTYWREERVQRGDTLPRILSRLKVHDDYALDMLKFMPEAQPLFQLTPGRTLRAASNDDGELLALHYVNGEQIVTVERDGEMFHIETADAVLETRVISATAVIQSSLFAAVDAANIPDSITKTLVENFATEIDFHRGLRKGDRLSVIYEILTHHGEPVGAGRLLAAEFVTQGKARNMVWFDPTPNKGGGAYFTFDGRDTRRAFLQSPLEVSRISSGFTDERYHPLLQTTQAHKGVDYVAPIGTKILATADGVVEFAGVQQGYGKVVILRHHNKYTTLYAHMSDFEKGIETGAKVKQGEVIGFVGMTGLTTGPHLHYEFRIDGVHHDPLSVAMPKTAAMAPDMKQVIKQAAAPHARAIALLRETTPSRFE